LSTDGADLTIVPRWAGEPLEFDRVMYTNSHSQRVSVTRLDMLLSRFALRRLDGNWVEQTNWFAFVNGRAGRTSVHVDEVPSGSFDRVRFTVGVPPSENHANPAGRAATHPLNPS